MNKCPICNEGELLPDDKQPQAGLHGYTVVYTCGTEKDGAIGSNDMEVSHKCTDGKKQSMKAMIDEMMVNRTKREFADLTFKIHDCPQTDIAMIHEYTGYMLKAMNKSETYDSRENRIIKAPELMVAVMKGCRGSANPMVVQELIKNLHKGAI